MSLGKRRGKQQSLFVASSRLPQSSGNAFYERLNRILADADFDAFVEELCEPYYADRRGRPSIPPGVFFRMLLIGYFEDLSSQREIAWRCSDSLSLRKFLGVALEENTPHHSSMTRVRDRLPMKVHEAVFRFVLQLTALHRLLKGKTVGVDSTMLEANAAMKSIVRRDTGEDWNEYLRRLMQAQGIENPSEEDLRRFDKQRSGKKVSNEEWTSSCDDDSRIARMKDGRTHLAYKAEHVVDLESEVIVGASIRHATDSDSQTLNDSVMEAQTHLNEAGVESEIEEVVADKGYHATDQLEQADKLGLRTYIPERQTPKGRRLNKLSDSKRKALLNNRKRLNRKKNKRLQCSRSERVERSFAHMCDTGGARRTWLRGLEKVQKRYLLTAAARNLGLIMRKLFGIGSPKGWKALGGVFVLLQTAWFNIWRSSKRIADHIADLMRYPLPPPQARWSSQNQPFSTGC